MKIAPRYGNVAVVVLALSLISFLVVATQGTPRPIKTYGTLDRRDAVQLDQEHARVCRNLGWAEMKQALFRFDPKAVVACLPYFTSHQNTQITIRPDGLALVELFYARKTPSGESISAVYERQGERWAFPARIQ